MTTVRVRNALLSVSDKEGIVELARALVEHGARIFSTGGTKGALVAAGLPVEDVQTLTGQPEAFGGRMKTLSFPVASGLLFDRERDRAEAEALGITPIDLVAVNLYPFASHKDRGLALGELIEWIDIGGPTMIRAAAKNFAHVAVLTSPAQYGDLVAELAAVNGTTIAARTRWMKAAFAATAAYDGMIAEHLAEARATVALPRFGAPETLRYGENPHQKATFSPAEHGLALEVLGGRELSYNNLVDLDAALDATWSLATPACAIVKHENPCGLATGPLVDALLPLAWAGDEVSAFGSVIAFNRPVTKTTLAFLEIENKEKRKFVEVIAAPAFSDGALEALAQSKNLRVLRVTDERRGPRAAYRVLSTGLLAQDADRTPFEKIEVVSAAPPTTIDRELLTFGLHAARCLKSNAIALVRREGDVLSLVGMGAGQPNRVRSTELAVAQARRSFEAASKRLEPKEREAFVRACFADVMLVSDAFFPFADGPEVALAAGVRLLVEPGGSIRDAAVIAAVDRVGAHLLFTGTRHFKH